jgi:hypothetical protein
VTRSPRHPCVILAGILGAAAALSCNKENVTQPRLTLTQLTVGVPLTDQVSRGAAKVYAAGVSSGQVYRVSVTGLTGDVDLYLFGGDSTFSSLVPCLIDRTISFNTTPEDCALIAGYNKMFIGIDGTYVQASSATYTIEVQPVTSSKRLSLSTPIPDSVAAGGDTLYSVAVSPGTAYTVSITALTDSAASLNVADGIQVHTSFQSTTPKDFTVTPADTVQYFAVDGFNVAAATGHFVIMATPAPVVVTPIVATSGSVPAATPTIGWVTTGGTSQYHSDGLSTGNHVVSIVGLTAAADFHVYPDATYSLEAPCTHLTSGVRECIVPGPSAYFAVSAGPVNAVGAGYIMLVW